MSIKDRAVKQQQCEDIQIESQACCFSIARSKSTKSAVSLKKGAYIKLKPSDKQKSLKTLNKSHQYLSHQSLKMPGLKLQTVTSTTTHQGHRLRISTSHKTYNDQEDGVSPSKRSLIAKKCIEYKNQKITQHSQIHESPQPSLSLAHQEKAQYMSTQRNTVWEQSPRVPSPLQFSNKINSCQSSLVQSQQPDSPSKSKTSFKLQVTKSKKTLEHLYQRQSGRKIQIFESQVSHVSDQDLYSIAESYDWRRPV